MGNINTSWCDGCGKTDSIASKTGLTILPWDFSVWNAPSRIKADLCSDCSGKIVDYIKSLLLHKLGPHLDS